MKEASDAALSFLAGAAVRLAASLSVACAGNNQVLRNPFLNGANRIEDTTTLLVVRRSSAFSSHSCERPDAATYVARSLAWFQVFRS